MINYSTQCYFFKWNVIDHSIYLIAGNVFGNNILHLHFSSYVGMYVGILMA